MSVLLEMCKDPKLPAVRCVFYTRKVKTAKRRPSVHLKTQTTVSRKFGSGYLTDPDWHREPMFSLGERLAPSP